MRKLQTSALCGTLIILGFTGIMPIPNLEPTILISNSEPTKSESHRILRIVVRDSKSQETISDVQVEIQTTQEVIKERTTHNGTLTYEIPKQNLGQVLISLKKEGYQPIKRQAISELINPNEVRTFYLERTEIEPEINKDPEINKNEPYPGIFWGCIWPANNNQPIHPECPENF